MSYSPTRPLLSGATSVIRARAKHSALAVAVAAGIAAAALSGSAQAADDTSLTWNGITLYGVVDVGLAYRTTAPLTPTRMVPGGGVDDFKEQQ